MEKPDSLTRLDSTVTSQPLIERVYIKTIISGQLIEVFQYQSPIYINRKLPTKKRERMSSRNKEYKHRSVTKARNCIRRIAEANFDDNSKFVTLTFNNENGFDITDIRSCDKRLRDFLKRIKQKLTDFKYVAVREFQKRGAVHYHLLTSLPYIEKEDLARIWGYGFVDIKKIKSTIGVGAYIAKYLSKNIEDERFKGIRSYITSKGLIRPKVLYGSEAEKEVISLTQKGISPSYISSYQSEFNGQVSFSEYNLSQSSCPKGKT